MISFWISVVPPKVYLIYDGHAGYAVRGSYREYVVVSRSTTKATLCRARVTAT